MNKQLAPDIYIQAEAILKDMLLLSKHLGLYHQTNAVVQEVSTRLMHHLDVAHRARFPVQLMVAKDYFLIQGVVIDPKNQLLGKYAYRMFQHGITSFTLTPELSVPSLYAFLKLITDTPSHTWDAGGMAACLTEAKISGIRVTEMSRDDFLLISADDPNQDSIVRRPGQEFWNRFARSLLSPLTDADPEKLSGSDFNPMALAGEISKLLAGTGSRESDAQTHINHTLVRGITTIQGDLQKTERAEILIKLAELVNNLDEAPGQSALSEICKQPISEELAREFFQRLSDKMIYNAYQQTTSGQINTPPRIMALICKLASDRKIVDEDELGKNIVDRLELSAKAGELLNAENLAQFVPEKYQNALNQVLSDPLLPEPLSKRLRQLKKSLEDFNVERQIAQMSIYLLRHQPDQEQLEALHQQIIKSMQFQVDAADYQSLQELCENSFSGRSDEDIKALTEQIPESLLKQILDDVSRLDKKYQPLIGTIIKLIGPPFISPLLQFTAVESNRSLRFYYLSHLKELGQQVASLASIYLADSQWFVARNMLLLIGELEASDQLPKVRPLLNHSHPKVRQEALKTCLLLGDKQSLNQVKASLASDNRQEVLNTITLCRLVNNNEISARLQDMLAHDSLFTFDLERKKALVQALAESRSPQALRLFARILVKRRLFHGQALAQLKVEIVKCLANYPARQVRTLLQQQLEKASPEVAVQARQILKKLQQQEDHDTDG